MDNDVIEKMRSAMKPAKDLPEAPAEPSLIVITLLAEILVELKIANRISLGIPVE